ncbi:hypothetical protein, partial [Actinophytocola xanthii]|uniref:hypothetical protein n=1 Tax=Actinophytocola xanthii TaxID=1912961 RepID=UPI001E3B373D
MAPLRQQLEPSELIIACIYAGKLRQQHRTHRRRKTLHMPMPETLELKAMSFPPNRGGLLYAAR